MNILIVENERPAAERLVRLLGEIDRDLVVTGIAETVEETINRLRNEPLPDLILMDIQLDDGLCFEAFENAGADIPVIFTTAYDDYMLRAFRVNSVDYLLKPVEESSLRQALQKYRSLHEKAWISKEVLQQLVRDMNLGYRNRFLIKIGTRYRSIPVEEISCFRISGRAVFIVTTAGKEYDIDHSLDYLQKNVDPRIFFRINRDCLVNIHAIRDIQSYSSNRLKVTLNPDKPGGDMLVSREKVAEFKKWIDQ